MESSGQATAPETIDSLAEFLMDNPDADAAGPAKEDQPQPAKGPEEDNPEAEQHADPDNEDVPVDQPKGDEELPNDDPEVDQPSQKFKVSVTGDDGEQTTQEVDSKELIAGYQRHRDYTVKMMQLADRERDVTQKVASHLNETRNRYLQQAQLAHAAVKQLAGLKSTEEMAALAAQNPSEWVQEQQRQTVVSQVLAGLEQSMRAEQEKAAAEQREAMQKAYHDTWVELKKEGIDPPKLKSIFETMQTRYKVPVERLNSVSDPTLVRIMRDAAAYQELKDRKAEVTKKVADAPRLPPSRQTAPKNEQLRKKINARFSSGKAKLDDLAAYISVNNL